jgi:hypothetical protein
MKRLFLLCCLLAIAACAQPPLRRQSRQPLRLRRRLISCSLTGAARRLIPAEPRS